MLPSGLRKWSPLQPSRCVTTSLRCTEDSSDNDNWEDFIQCSSNIIIIAEIQDWPARFSSEDEELKLDSSPRLMQAVII
ncbi:hypothetical protein P8452_56397 [Trifolium repens]|nr:hypothetical protein P8452_56397 [Trifolium repens]